MPRHDYDFPPDWESFTDDEKCEWYSQERSRRQVERQVREGNYPFMEKMVVESKRRAERRLESRSETVSLKEHR